MSIQDELQAIIDANPDTVNPTNPGSRTCVYDDRLGNHCLIGEWAISKGHKLPNSNVGAEGIAEDMGWVETYEEARYLGDVQCLADGKGLDEPRRWGDIVLPDQNDYDFEGVLL